MAKTFASPRGRLSAAVTGRGREVGAEEAHVRNVLALTKRIHGLLNKRTRMRRELAELGRELRAKRTELRIVLQRVSDPLVLDSDKVRRIDTTETALEAPLGTVIGDDVGE
jgi:hypothetical protein